MSSTTLDHDWPDAVDVADWCDPRRVALWDAINEYAVACGGDPGEGTIGSRRMDAVVKVERVMRSYTHPTGPDGNRLIPVYEHYPPPRTPLVAQPAFWVGLVLLSVWLIIVVAV